jgi:hypothetical protein
MLHLFYWVALYGAALVTAAIVLLRLLDLIRGPRPTWRRALNEVIWTALPVVLLVVLVQHTGLRGK